MLRLLLDIMLQGGGLKDYIGYVVLIAGLLSACAIVATFWITKTYYKTGLADKLTEKYKALYDADEIEIKRLKDEKAEAIKAKEIADKERADMYADYSGLTQLYATKSLILERITGHFGGVLSQMKDGDIPGAIDKLRSGEIDARALRGETDPHTTKS